MDKPEQPIMYALVNCERVLVPVEQLGMFQSCIQVESAYEKREDGKYESIQFISEMPKLPQVSLVHSDQVTAWQVLGKLRAK